ncbi:MAG TPA: hypothetical protein DCO79_11480 [Spirochaeta sp.]|nr:hypothetical protein [Spirochaeta sp.]
MKNVFTAFLIISVLIISSCVTPTTEADSDSRNLSNVEKAETAETAEKAETENKGKTAVTEVVSIPYLLKDTNYFSDGYIESYKVYSYNDDMSIAREDLFDSFDELIESTVYEPMSDGALRRSLFDARGTLQSWRKLVTADGLSVRIESYNSEDELQTVSENTYDAEGNLTVWKILNGSGVVLSETRYIYESGENTKIEIYDTSMMLREYFINEFEDGLIVKNSHYDENDKIKTVVEYAYEDGVLVSGKYLRANGSTSRTMTYSNDEKGSPLKTETFDGNGKLKDWNEKEYEYVSKEITVWK